MPFQFNDAQAIQSGMALVPNLREQLLQDATLELQRRQVDNDTAVIAAKRQEAQTEAELSAAYQRDLDAAILEGTPQAIRRLQTKYPATTKDAKESFEALDDDLKAGILTQMGTIHERAAAGDFAGAAEKLEARIAADKAAGEDTTDDQEILAGLRSEDPLQRRIATGMIAFSLRAIAGDKFDAVTKALEPDRKTPEELQYEFDVRTYGKAYADQAKLTRDSKTVSLVPGGRLDTFGPDPSLVGGGQPQGGGDPVSSGGGAPAGAPSLTVEQFRANVDAIGPERASRLTSSNGIPVVVRSVQEANSLPPGTLYVTPTGERYTR